MSESAVRVERFELRSSSFLWSVPDKPVSVRFSLDVVERLGQEIIEAFRSVTSRGSEIGGLLLGTTTHDSRPVVLVENYELVEIDYSRGPLYRLNDADRKRFDNAIERRAAGTSRALSVLGFFRSNTRKGIVLDAEDISLLNQKFTDPLSTVLLVRPFATPSKVAFQVARSLSDDRPRRALRSISRSG